MHKGLVDIPNYKEGGPKFEGYEMEADGLLQYQGRMYIPKEGDIRETILKISKILIYCMHPKVNNMFEYMKELFFWKGMK